MSPGQSESLVTTHSHLVAKWSASSGKARQMALDDFLAIAGEQGWEVVAAGNVDARHHRLYLKRARQG